ncbi:hypothetical protein [Rhodocyclus purpureus]|uniref:hypothetical protein n=1 Tax=Rhodocyclus purpureus TaxID=1067 RepID=UPI00191390DB|nr:hypothetical protein [Rhodocyclus purpureus]MBK5915572.1 hypothetical protein [Rhodocyclus purpureus]
MGFSDAKRRVLEALATGAYQHEARRDIDVKNRFQTGEITADQVAALIRKCNGNDHKMSPHHSLKSVAVHVLTKDGWYIKFYFLEPDTWFISVHP